MPVNLLAPSPIPYLMVGLQGSGKTTTSGKLALRLRTRERKSDEANNGSGRMDDWKRDRLAGVGADVVIPDYRDAAPLLELILGR